MYKLKKILLIICIIFLSLPALSYQTDETLLLLDSTGSMIEPFEGKTKIEIGAQAAFQILQRMNDSQKIGLRTIGVHPSEIERLIKIQSREEVCRQTKLMNSISSYNRNNIQHSLEKLYPFGPSPLEYSLKKVINTDFSYGSHKKRIILITDGYETCDGDPCGYIQQIRNSRPDITIDIVAIGASDYEITSLRCLTNATNGKLYNIQSNINNLSAEEQLASTINYLTKMYSPNVKNIDQAFKSIGFNNIKPSMDLESKPYHNIKYKSYLLEFNE